MNQKLRTDIPGLAAWYTTHSVGDMVQKLESALTEAGFTLFARFDHSLAAGNVGLALAPTVVIVFGNPSGGTALMQAVPTMAIDLPSRILVRQSKTDNSEVFFNLLGYVADRHRLVLAEMENTIDGFDKKVAGIIENCLT